MFRPLREWPRVSRIASDISKLQPSPYIGHDWEWSIRTGEPTVLGLSDGKLTVSVPDCDGRPYLQSLIHRFPNAEWVGHNYLTADLKVANDNGIKINPKKVWDTIILWWLSNMHLSKGTKSAEDQAEKRGRGFNSIWFPCAAHTDARNWKHCIGEGCEEEGRPCPEHNVPGYNGCDAYWPVMALPGMLQRARMLGVDKLYPLHRDLALVLSGITDRGVLVDVPYVDTLRKEISDAKLRYWNPASESGLLEFNPASPKQAVEFFRRRDIKLENAQEETVTKALKDYSDPQLTMFAEHKLFGNGPDRWFKPRTYDYDKYEWDGYVDPEGYAHPRFNYFTSSSRLACVDPNWQNIPSRTELGQRIRAAVIAPDGYNLITSDMKNGENRVFLFLAGYTDLPDEDFHSWVRDMMGLQEDHPFSVKYGGARSAAKSVSHASNYGEGLSLISRAALRNSQIQREVSAGARIVFADWIFCDLVVTFTGINLANRAFGSASYENRRLALDVQEKYFARFPKIRGLQREITRKCEVERAVRPPHGYVTASYGNPSDRFKTALAIWGSQPVAHMTKLALIQAEQDPILRCNAQIHDALNFYVRSDVDLQVVRQRVEEAMMFETPEIPGLRIPVDVKYGKRTPESRGHSTWAHQVKIPANTKVTFSS